MSRTWKTMSVKAKVVAAVAAALAGAATGVIIGLLIGPSLIHASSPAAISLPPSQGAPSSSVATPPPGAWVTIGSRRTWASFGSFCWERSCVKAKADAPGHPVVLVDADAGSTLRVHFAFLPSAVSVREGTSSRKMPARETVVIPVVQAGVIDVRAQTKSGWVSYLVRIRLTRKG